MAMWVEYLLKVRDFAGSNLVKVSQILSEWKIDSFFWRAVIRKNKTTTYNLITLIYSPHISHKLLSVP